MRINLEPAPTPAPAAITWHNWDNSVFEKAKEQDKPILLNITAPSSYWCNIMEIDCYQDSLIKEFLEKHFICIKLQQDDIPEIDSVYQIAQQLANGRSGWPITAFLNHNKEPFFVGSYIYKADVENTPGFFRLIQNIEGIWKNERTTINENAQKFASSIKSILGQQPIRSGNKLDLNAIELIIEKKLEKADFEQGGFTELAKNIPYQFLFLCLEVVKQKNLSKEIIGKCERFLGSTLKGIGLSALHDMVGGGFHRCSIDSTWNNPRFEKLLVENAHLLSLYSKSLEILTLESDEQWLFERCKNGIIVWLQNEMLGREGLFYNATYAYNEDEDGIFYLWSEKEIQEALGYESDYFCNLCSITSVGNYNDEVTKQSTGFNIISLKGIPEKKDNFTKLLSGLNTYRALRVPPKKDKRIFLEKNALIVTALLDAGKIDTAKYIVDNILKNSTNINQLSGNIKNSDTSQNGTLGDYATLTLALYKISSKLQDSKYHLEAVKLTEVMNNRFYHNDVGYSLSDNKEYNLFGDITPVYDTVSLSSTTRAIECLYHAGYMERAEEELNNLLPCISENPDYFYSMMALKLRVL